MGIWSGKPPDLNMVRDVCMSNISEVVNELGDHVVAAGFYPDCIVYIETSARLMAAILCNRFQVRALPLLIQRKGSRIKEGISCFLRLLPNSIKDKCRRAESRWLLKKKIKQRKMATSVVADLRGLKVLIVDDAVDTGASVRMARKWVAAMGADQKYVKVAVIAITTEIAEKEADFYMYRELCRFPWSSDSREHESYNKQYHLTNIPVFGLYESNE
jgi:uncharacterized protein